MIRLRQIKVDVSKDSILQVRRKVLSKLKIADSDIRKLKINKKSIDARRKDSIYYIYEVDVLLDENLESKILSKNKSSDVFSVENSKYEFKITGTKKLINRPIIVGSGPCGLFCAYLLAESGYRPIIIERGEKIEDRVLSVSKFWNSGILNEDSNVQFGEGGAGTFSDGKLNTMIKDKKNRFQKVFEIFVKNGAPDEILYINKPHIGTDLLKDVIINMRKTIIKNGGEFRYNTTLTNLVIDDGKIKKIEVNHNEIIDCNILVLAIGHSARDTFQMLYDNGLEMISKPFAIGIRIQHPQKLIDYNQYGDNKFLEKASYKLTYKASNNRGVYSFCMCPGGYVVNSSSEEGMLAVNGMSNHARDSLNANSAIIVTVNSFDFGTNPLDGIKYQRKIEKLAYQKGDGSIPIQLYRDFKNNTLTEKFGDVKPIFKGNYKFSNLNEILPKYICESLKEGIDYFNSKIENFSMDDAILAGVETRTSSPLRIVRDDNYLSNILGIYPGGEGAGYAGGITSSAIDGVKIAEQIATIYTKFSVK